VKWVRSNGLVLEVREVGEVIYTMRARPPTGAALPAGLSEVMTDDEARELVAELRKGKLYDEQLNRPGRPAGGSPDGG